MEVGYFRIVPNGAVRIVRDALQIADIDRAESYMKPDLSRIYGNPTVKLPKPRTNKTRLMMPTDPCDLDTSRPLTALVLQLQSS